jgi:hypothetical protein
MGLVNLSEYYEMKTINDIRNAFAHDLIREDVEDKDKRVPLSFSTKYITDYCNTLLCRHDIEGRGNLVTDEELYHIEHEDYAIKARVIFIRSVIAITRFLIWETQNDNSGAEAWRLTHDDKYEDYKSFT